MAPLAAELGVVLPISIFEREGPHYFNSLVMADADGSLLGLYRKSHIPDGPGYQEKYYFQPGDTGFKVWDTRFGRIGVGICWDQWYPEAARAMALMGAEVLLYPTAIGSSRMTRASTPPAVAQGHAGPRGQQRHPRDRRQPHRLRALGRLSRRWPEPSTAPASSPTIAATWSARHGPGRGRRGLGHLRPRLPGTHRAAWGFFRDRRPDLYGALSGPRPA
jgi:N-carbamoylputrescine amidase